MNDVRGQRLNPPGIKPTMTGAPPDSGVGDVPRTEDHRWQQGSEFHWIDYDAGPPAMAPWDGRAAFFGSGRDSLRSLARFGRENRGWRRLWVPTYFCQEVVAALASEGLDLALYPCTPGNHCQERGPSALRCGDILLRVNYFGLQGRPPIGPQAEHGVEVIEDHTHDPWSPWARTSDADWCVASLRKGLPLPDGGVTWSPRGHELPGEPPVTDGHEIAALRKLAAMLLKTAYLKGHAVAKPLFRELAAAGESGLAGSEVSGMPRWTRELLQTFPIEVWREQRRRNHAALTAALADAPWVTVLQTESPEDACPSSAVLLFDGPDLRAHVDKQLKSNGVYPAILWPLEQPVLQPMPAESIDFSRRMLSIHCDWRYETDDMLRVAKLIQKSGGSLRAADDANTSVAIYDEGS